MRKSNSPLVALAMFAALGLCRTPAMADDAKGFTAIFNGKDLSGWRGDRTMDPRLVNAMCPEEREAKRAVDAAEAAKHWWVENGEIVTDGWGPFLGTEKEYGDIELHVDYKIGPGGDNGVYLRGTPQIQIWDFSDPTKASHGADKGSGGLWNNTPGAPGRDPLVLADNPIGEWNTLRVVQIGSRTTIHLNDKLVVADAIMENYWDAVLPIVPQGPIQLQTHRSEARFRNIKVREIPADEADAYLINLNGGAAGFTSLFNGEDLAGWAGAVDDFETVDGAIRSKLKRGAGVLYHDKELGDFIARLEFRLPPAGMSGLAIRYPGEGPAHDAGMTELVILDNDHPKYKHYERRQRHASALGLAPAAQGYLRPAGAWNFQVVTVKGSTIQVELNGTVVLDADLGRVKKFMTSAAHSGKDRETGFFGLVCRNQPVEFRNIYIKEID